MHRRPAAARHLAEASVARDDLLLTRAALGQRLFPGLDEVFGDPREALPGREPRARCGLARRDRRGHLFKARDEVRGPACSAGSQGQTNLSDPGRISTSELRAISSRSRASDHRPGAAETVSSLAPMGVMS